MPTLFVVSSQPLAGKTTVAAGLARKLASRRQVDITELPAGESGDGKGRAIVVALPAEDPAGHAKTAGLAGVIVNHAASRKMDEIRAAYEKAGTPLLAVVPEDALLASPTIGEVAEALNAEGANIEQNRDRPLDRPVIASIAADPGQNYFVRTDATAVIVRSDKPDLQLAALNAGPTCLIVTGGLPVLSYVLERVADEEIPLIRTKLDTKETVEAIEGLFGARPFSGSEAKLRRIEELLANVDVDALFERSAARPS